MFDGITACVFLGATVKIKICRPPSQCDVANIYKYIWHVHPTNPVATIDDLLPQHWVYFCTEIGKFCDARLAYGYKHLFSAIDFFVLESCHPSCGFCIRLVVKLFFKKSAHQFPFSAPPKNKKVPHLYRYMKADEERRFIPESRSLPLE